MRDWRVKARLEGGLLLLEGDGISLFAAEYAAPWPLELLEEVRSAASSLRPRRCILLGGHIGEVALALRGACDDLLIYEPDPAHCELLMENLEANGVRAEVRCGYVGARDGRRTMRPPTGGPVRVEVVGVNRVLRGGVDLAVLCCSSCSSFAASLSCESLSLVKAYVAARGSPLMERLGSCGFEVSEFRSIALATERR